MLDSVPKVEIHKLQYKHAFIKMLLNVSDNGLYAIKRLNNAPVWKYQHRRDNIVLQLISFNLPPISDYIQPNLPLFQPHLRERPPKICDQQSWRNLLRTMYWIRPYFNKFEWAAQKKRKEFVHKTPPLISGTKDSEWTIYSEPAESLRLLYLQTLGGGVCYKNKAILGIPWQYPWLKFEFHTHVRTYIFFFGARRKSS